MNEMKVPEEPKCKNCGTTLDYYENGNNTFWLDCPNCNKLNDDEELIKRVFGKDFVDIYCKVFSMNKKLRDNLQHDKPAAYISYLQELKPDAEKLQALFIQIFSILENMKVLDEEKDYDWESWDDKFYKKQTLTRLRKHNEMISRIQSKILKNHTWQGYTPKLEKEKKQ